MNKKNIYNYNNINSFIIDVQKKKQTIRIAKSTSLLIFPNDLKFNIINGDIITPKGAVFKTSSIIGLLAIKNICLFFPFCHQIFIKNCFINIKLLTFNNIKVVCEVLSNCETGVEMESILGTSIASINIYDMLKYLTTDVIIKNIKLEKKVGGKNDYKF